MTNKTATTTTADVGELRARAEGFARQAAEAQAELDRRGQEELGRQREAQAERDRALVANYDRSADEKAVRQARDEVDRVAADMPLTVAIAQYIAVQDQCVWNRVDVMAARGRLGLPTGGQQPHSAQAPDPVSHIVRAAAQAAAEQTAKARAEQEG